MNPALQKFLGWSFNGVAAFVGYKWPQYLPEATGLVGLIVGWLHLPQPNRNS